MSFFGVFLFNFLQNMSVIGTGYKIGKLSLEEIDPQFEGGSASADS